MQIQTNRSPRKGAVAPLTALLLIPLMGMLAFAIDLGWIVAIQSDLQSAADAAALAGASPLMDGYVQYNLPNQTAAQKTTVLNTTKTKAKTAAKNFASYNGAGVTSLTLNDGDIEFGFTDSSGTYSSTSTNFPNTIKVTLRRDSSANGSLSLFFGKVLGRSSQDLTANAAATIYEANIASFQNVSNFKLGMLPMTYDINNWNSFLSTGMAPGATSIQYDSSGNPIIQVYPSIKDTGNFGLFSLSDQHIGASTISDWIANGMRQADVASLLSASQSGQTPLIPLTSHNANILPSNSTDGKGSWNWIGDTGLKTSDVHTLSDYVGNTYLMPLFKPLDASDANYTAGSGQGSNYYFNIIQFVSVKIVSTGNSTVVVQPSPTILDFSQVTFGPTPVPAGSSGSTTATTFTAPKLTQ